MKAIAKLTTYNIYVDYGCGVRNKRLLFLSSQIIHTLKHISGVCKSHIMFDCTYRGQVPHRKHFCLYIMLTDDLNYI